MQLSEFLLKNDINFTEQQINQVFLYIDLLIKWNKVYNLTNIKKKEDILARHIFESLEIIKHIKNNKLYKIIDVGTGAGVPGIILAIAMPEIQFFLCDINDKKLTFLRQAIIELKLTNALLVDQKIENYTPGFYFDIIISKAFSSLESFLIKTQHLGDKTSLFVTFKAKKDNNLTSSPVPSFLIDAIINQQVEQNDYTRKLILLKKKTI